MSLKNKFLVAFAANPQFFTIGGAILIVVVVGGALLLWSFHQTDSKQEQKADQDRVTTIGTQADANVTLPPVIDAQKTVANAEKQVSVAEKSLPRAHQRSVETAKNANVAARTVKNTVLEDAEKERCLTYPESCK